MRSEEQKKKNSVRDIKMADSITFEAVIPKETGSIPSPNQDIKFVLPRTEKDIPPPKEKKAIPERSDQI